MLHSKLKVKNIGSDNLAHLLLLQNSQKAEATRRREKVSGHLADSVINWPGMNRKPSGKLG